MIRRIRAILRKEAQDIVTNFNVSIMLAIPLGIVFLFERLLGAMGPAEIAGFGVVFLGGMAGTYVPSMLLAEERDKRTLEMLMLSPATPFEIFVGKGLLTLISTLIFALLIFLVLGIPAGQIPWLLLIFGLGVAVCIPLGMIVGMLAPNLMSTGLVGMPLYMGFTLIPTIARASETLRRISKVMPTAHIHEATINVIQNGADLGYIGTTAGYLILMFGVACAILVLVYRKRSGALA